MKNSPGYADILILAAANAEKVMMIWNLRGLFIVRFPATIGVWKYSFIRQFWITSIIPVIVVVQDVAVF